MSTSPDSALQSFRDAQRTAMQCMRGVVSGLSGGETELQVAERLVTAAYELGAEGFFHTPLVWFGARTALDVMRKQTEAFPGATRLEEGMPLILDFAPIFGRCAVDVSLASSLGSHALVSEGKELLRGMRPRIPELLAEGLTAREVFAWVVEEAGRKGWHSKQHNYLLSALGHRVFHMPRMPFARRSVVGLGVPSAVALFGRALLSRIPLVPVAWPFWNDSPLSAARPSPGLWSFEPHLERDGVGVKWEELLVVDETSARWLDSDDALELLLA